MSNFTDAITIVTGAGSGMGKTVSQELARRGAHIVASDINEDTVSAVVDEIVHAGGKATAAQVDVTNELAVQQLVEETVATHGRLDYIFNNAGIAVAGDYRDITLDHWRRIVDVNVWGVIYGAHAAYKIMVEQGHGHIVNTASVAGLIPTPSEIIYTATKHMVVGYSQSLRMQGEALGVKVSAICPGFIQTGIFDAAEVPNVNKEEGLARLRGLPSAEYAAQAIVRGVERNQALIVFPFVYRALWWLHRMHPSALSPLMRFAVSELRKLRQVS